MYALEVAYSLSRRTSHMSQNRSPESKNISGRFILPFFISYGLMIVLMIIPLLLAGPLKVLANIRLLKTFVNAGIIRYTDHHIGLIEGVGDLNNYLKASSPIDWWLVLLCFTIYILHFYLKSFQFHMVKSHLGDQSSFRNNARLYFLGNGLNKLIPFKFGNHFITKSDQEDATRNNHTLGILERLTNVEILIFFILSVFLTGWRMTLVQIIPALLILIIAHYVLKPFTNTFSEQEDSRGLLALFQKSPYLLSGLVFISLFVFLLDDIVPYVISQAFTEYPVIMNVNFLTIQGAVVAGYIASRVQLTPGGIGQYELGFGTALYLAGVGMPEAVSIAILDGVLRQLAAMFLYFFGIYRSEKQTRLSELFKSFAN